MTAPAPPSHANEGVLSGITGKETPSASPHHGQRLQAIGQMAAGIAHDFNNLLTTILAAAESGLERAETGSDTADDLRQIRLAAERGAVLVRQLLAFSRRGASAAGAVMINAAIAALHPLLQRLAGPHITVVLDLAEPDSCVTADPGEIDQVLVNLVANARDALRGKDGCHCNNAAMVMIRTAVDHGGTPEPWHRFGSSATSTAAGGSETGSGSGNEAGAAGVSIPCAPASGTSPARPHVIIEVADTGPGIPPEALPRIFEPFFTTRGDAGGTGLGLSTVTRIAQRSGGFVAVTSVPGQGATFRVHLPLRAADMPDLSSRPAATRSASPVPGHGTVLLVEDEPSVRRLTERALRKAGWDVLVAASAEEAQALLSAPDAAPPALVVSDIALPGMAGTGLAAELRRRWPGLPIILVSGYAESGGGSDPVGKGLAFLPKPYTMHALLTLIGTLRSDVPR